MAGGREIKTKIKSVQNTRKVTRALEMVSASKIRKAQERMKTSRPYAQAMKQVIGHLAQASTDYQHPFLVEREQDPTDSRAKVLAVTPSGEAAAIAAIAAVEQADRAFFGPAADTAGPALLPLLHALADR